MPVGPALTFHGHYVDRIKLFHTMEPAYTMFWRKNQSPAEQVAVQQLNQQGLYPSKNNRSDFSGGQYPAPIVLGETGKPGCEGYYHRGVCSCTSCCPGQTATPMAEIVDRKSCSSCPFPYPNGLQSPGRQHAHGGMHTMNRDQVQRMERDEFMQRRGRPGRHGYGYGYGLHASAEPPAHARPGGPAFAPYKTSGACSSCALGGNAYQ